MKNLEDYYIVHCPFCGAENKVMISCTDYNTAGLIMCSNCGQMF